MRIVPSDPDKIYAVAVQLMTDYSLPAHAARKITASLYGFSGWSDLNAALAGDRDLADEDQPVSIVNDRRAFAKSVLASALKLDDEHAFYAAKALDPYSRNAVRTTLREASDPIFDMTDEDMDRIASKMLGRPITNFDDMNRRLARPGAATWLRFLRDKLGFVLTQETPVEDQSLAQIAIAVGTHEWPVWRSCLSYSPGDNEDDLLEEAQAAIAAKCERALLLFYTPLFLAYAPDDAVPDANGKVVVTDAVIYGGRIYQDGRWGDFTFGPNGLDSVLAYRVRSITSLSRSYLADHRIPNGLNLVIDLSREIADQYAARTGIPMGDTPTLQPFLRGWSAVLFLPDEIRKGIAQLKNMQKFQEASYGRR